MHVVGCQSVDNFMSGNSSKYLAVTLLSGNTAKKGDWWCNGGG